MGFFLPNNKKIKGIFVQNAPNTYLEADLTPENMQHGMKGWSHGKLIVGTGKAFEFAKYGLRKVELLTDSKGMERYGIELEDSSGTNLILVSSAKGDTFLQTKHLVELLDGEPLKIGQNLTTGGEIYALQNESHLKIYFTEIQDNESRLRFFVGKDNEI